MDLAKKPSASGIGDLVFQLASARFEKYYHHSTGTHIIKQLEGTEFQPFAVKGVGEFADEAYADFCGRLRAYIAKSSESELATLAANLRRFTAAAIKKFELQVQLSEQITSQLKDSAKAESMSIGSYVNQLIIRALPAEITDQVLDVWYSDIMRKRPSYKSDSKGLSHIITFPVGLLELDRLERLIVRIRDKKHDTPSINEMLSGILSGTISAAQPAAFKHIH